MDEDSKMLRALNAALTELQVKYRESDFDTQEAIEPELLDLMDKYVAVRRKLLLGSVIMTAADLAAMAEIRQEIDDAADKQALILAIARTAFFIASRL